MPLAGTQSNHPITAPKQGGKNHAASSSTQSLLAHFAASPTPNHIRTGGATSIIAARRAIVAAAILITVASLERRDVDALRERNAVVLVGGILLTHRQSLIGGAVGPDEDGGADDLGAVGVFPCLCGADVGVGRVFVALVVAPDTFGGGAAVLGDVGVSRLLFMMRTMMMGRRRKRRKKRGWGRGKGRPGIGVYDIPGVMQLG